MSTNNEQPFNNAELTSSFNRDAAVKNLVLDIREQEDIGWCEPLPEWIYEWRACEEAINKLIDACIANVTKDCYCYTKPAFMNTGREDNPWQPIETAPKDGTEIELFLPRVHTGRRRRDERIVFPVKFYGQHGKFYRDDCGDYTPSHIEHATHWRLYYAPSRRRRLSDEAMCRLQGGFTRAGKTKAGNVLDGQVWQVYPSQLMEHA